MSTESIALCLFVNWSKPWRNRLCDTFADKRPRREICRPPGCLLSLLVNESATEGKLRDDHRMLVISVLEIFNMSLLSCWPGSRLRQRHSWVTERTRQDDTTWHTTASVCAVQPPAARQHAELPVRPSVDQHLHGVNGQGRHVPPESAQIPSLWYRHVYRQAARRAQQNDDHVY